MEENDFHLSYPIGKENEQEAYDKPFNEELKDQLLSNIKALPSLLEYSIQNLNEEQLQIPYRPGGWTVNQLVHHVADSHMNAYIRFKLGLTEENPSIKPYDQDAWAQLNDTKNLPINISLTLLHSLHRRWFEMLQDIDETKWQRTVYHPERKKTIPLWELLKMYSWHGMHHTAHINKLRERMNWN